MTFLAMLAVACEPSIEPWTSIEVRDPSRIAVLVETPRGKREISPSGAPAGTTYLPASVPPFTETDCTSAWVIRGANRAIALGRDRCRARDFNPYLGAALVDADGRSVLIAHDDELPRWIGEELHWNGSLIRQWGNAQQHRGRSERVVSVELVTPRDNVIAITHGPQKVASVCFRVRTSR